MAAESPTSALRRAAAEAKNGAGLLSPRFRSVAELAGWDEESILLAALVVEDTPVRESRRKRRPSSSASAGGSAGSNTRKRRSRRQSPGETPIPPVTLVLDDDDGDDDKPNNPADAKKEEEQNKVSALEGKEASGSAKDAVAMPCMDRLREELSCAICLDICFEPSTTPCGHSFCLQCLKHAASKCGKRCPKCRQLISNSRSCTINTVLWNTIQLLFPSEVEARRTSIASCSASMDDDVKQSVPRSSNFTQGGMRTRNTSTSSVVQDSARTNRSFVTPGSRRSMQGPGSMNTSTGSFDTQDRRSTRSRGSSRSFVQASQLLATGGSAQSDDSALAYRLQQEEFMTAFHTEDGERQPQNAVSTARANLRAMASRAVRLRARGWPL
ncbi:E3 ubiquitin-protein ligase RING1-like [Lolium rigidum]|uniref:E3 ubiquitin-protein ligase RING1-like n=1 Tax=Lolium rigidum TaxID=89674 RepID=UPI001F5CD267|nr:E3 ubiquitin-protein ligase RING1-like [Lolium rigidum]